MASSCSRRYRVKNLPKKRTTLILYRPVPYHFSNPCQRTPVITPVHDYQSAELHSLGALSCFTGKPPGSGCPLQYSLTLPREYFRLTEPDKTLLLNRLLFRADVNPVYSSELCAELIVGAVPSDHVLPIFVMQVKFFRLAARNQYSLRPEQCAACG